MLRQEPPGGVQQFVQGLVQGQDGQLVGRLGPGLLQLDLMQPPEPRQAIPGVHDPQGLPGLARAGAGLDQPDRLREFQGFQFGVHGAVFSPQSSVLSLQ